MAGRDEDAVGARYHVINGRRLSTARFVVTGNTVSFDPGLPSTAWNLAASLQDWGTTLAPDIFTSDGNSFDNNTYHLPSLTNKNWAWGESVQYPGLGRPNPITWSAWQVAGQDVHGSVGP